MLERSSFVRRSHPSHVLSLLLQAGIAAHEQATQAWRRWNEIRSFETLSSPEKQLIAAFAQRIVELDPRSPFRPRIEGLARQQWTMTEVSLGQAVEGLDHLARADIPFVLLGDSALHVERFAAPWRPLAGNAAILVPGEAAQDCVDVLASAGWISTSSREASRRRRLSRGATVIHRNGRQGRIDLYITAFRGLGSRDADRAVWRKAQPATLRELAVLVPDPTDAILVDLTCAALGSPAAWAQRIRARITHQTIDWVKFTDAAEQHGLVLSCLGGLGYMRDVLNVPIPATVLSFLRSAPLHGTAWLGYLANERHSEDRDLWSKILAYSASRLLQQQERIADTKPAVKGR